MTQHTALLSETQSADAMLRARARLVVPGGMWGHLNAARLPEGYPQFFASAEGPVVNEIAPRVHNSGHWTIEGAVTSQFEQHIRAICDLPPGVTGLTRGHAVMDNLIGRDIERWPELVEERGAHVHIYGKGEARPGRKMGHVTRVTR